jgi:hypothetical protein
MVTGIFLPMLISTDQLPLYAIICLFFLMAFFIGIGITTFIDFYILERGKKHESNRKKK